MDVWAADEPNAPAILYFHGGGFRGGDKKDVPGELIKGCKEAGITLISANYRLSHQAVYPAPMKDGARAVQFVRAHASKLGIDPERIGLAGSSAGAGIALWVAFHEDLASPESIDPVERSSTRVACVGVVGAQSSYDPNEIKEWLGGRAHEHPALEMFLGMSREEMERPAAREILRDASPIHHLSAGDPPVWMYYFEPDGPIPADAGPGKGIHHPKFGWVLKERMEAFGIGCRVLRMGVTTPDGPDPGPERGMVDYFRDRLVDRAVEGLVADRSGQGVPAQGP
jgi:acetyl esterase/lipase